MQTLPFTPTDAYQFVNLMETIWDTGDAPTPDGGIVLHESPWYSRWHNARITAKFVGMHRTGSSPRNGEKGQIFRFPYADDGVWIADHGGACAYTSHRFAPKTRAA